MRQCSLWQLPSFYTSGLLPRLPHYAFRLPRECLPPSGCTSPPHGSTSPFTLWNTFSSRATPRACERRVWWTSSRAAGTQSVRNASSQSSWLARQSSDRFAREAKVQNLKSRAAFKLLQIHERYNLLRPGMTVVDLGYAPGSWSQVAIDMVRPGLGRVVGVDLIPIQPPKGVNGIQGDFTSPDVQARLKEFLHDESRGKLRRSQLIEANEIIGEDAGYLDRERAATESEEDYSDGEAIAEHGNKCVDVVLSDMSAPWDITSGLYKNSISNPYRRLRNTTGNRFRDHAGSMDLCRSALYFCYDTLKIGGHFVCKYYQGAEDKQFEKQLKAMFSRVHREKPESSRSESREAYFVALKRLASPDKDKVFAES